MSPAGDIAIYGSQQFLACGAPSACIFSFVFFSETTSPAKIRTEPMIDDSRKINV